MPVSRSTPVNFSKISQDMSIVSERWMNGVIEIIDPNLKDLSWDEWTNTMVGSEVLLWSGAARIQPVSNISSEINAGRSVLSTRRVRFQVPLDQTRDFVRAGLVVRVTDGGEFSDLEKLQFNVSSAVSSSYAWLLTIECEADVKSELDAGGS